MSDAPGIQRFTDVSGAVTRTLGQGIDTLAISNTVGGIVLRGAERDDIRIGWTKYGDPGSPEWDGLALEVERSAARISVRPRHPERRFPSGSAWIDLEIEIPAVAMDLAIDLENGARAVDAAGVSCRAFRLAVAAGSARLRDVSAEIRIQSASGDVAADTVSGNLTVRAASGDIAILGHRQGVVTIETASGDVRWRPVDPADARIRTVSGDIVAEVPNGSGWQVDVRSVSGNASLPPRFGRSGRKAWVAAGAANDAVGTIEARTVSGDVTVIDVAPAPAGAPGPAHQARPGDRDGILQAVERGDLGVDEALRLLDDLPGAQPA